MAFEQGKILPTPETVPFRLSRDIVDGMGITGVEGVFRRSVASLSTSLLLTSDMCLCLKTKITTRAIPPVHKLLSRLMR